MIELIQFPWSPYCIVQRRILEYSGVRFRIKNIPNPDRTLVWRLSRQRYYAVPILREGKSVIFETEENSQVIAKYLDDRLQLGLFPKGLEGIQSILWRHIENEVESLTFRLNDVHYDEFVPERDRLGFIRHKERKFGRGCLELWKERQKEYLQELTRLLQPYEQMLVDKPFLLEARPRFVDFDLCGMLGNFLYSGHYELPRSLPRLREWYGRASTIESASPQREKLHS